MSGVTERFTNESVIRNCFFPSSMEEEGHSLSELKSEGGGGGALAIAAAMTASISADVGARELAPLMSVIVTCVDGVR